MEQLFQSLILFYTHSLDIIKRGFVSEFIKLKYPQFKVPGKSIELLSD